MGRARQAGRHEEVAELFERYRRFGDSSARERLVVRFLPLARKLAGQYARSAEPYEDLVQVASCALLRAVDRFDPQHGNEFAAFAVPTILGELKRHFRDATWTLHVPRSAQERALQIDSASEHLSAVHGRSPTVEQLAEYLKLTTEQVLDGLQAAHAYTATSLDATPERDDGSGSFEQAAHLGVEDDRFELIDADISIAGALRALPERERKVLFLRFVGDLTQSQIAARIGVSQMQVSRLLRRALAQVRREVGAEALADGPLAQT